MPSFTSLESSRNSRRNCCRSMTDFKGCTSKCVKNFYSCTDQWPVIIAGAGPTGLTLSTLLSQFGIPSLLLERAQALTTHPQVTQIHKILKYNERCILSDIHRIEDLCDRKTCVNSSVKDNKAKTLSCTLLVLDLCIQAISLAGSLHQLSHNGGVSPDSQWPCWRQHPGR